jgi:hypothetical protein
MLALSGCVEVSGGVPVVTPSPELLATPTLPATPQPGSAADERDAAATVRQFADAMSSDDELVALLLLSPSAQQVVSSSDLTALLGRPDYPRRIDVRAIRIERDIAIVTCEMAYGDGVQPLQLRLVRLDGQWKIDARLDE